MNRIKKTLLTIALIATVTTAFSSASDDWLWQDSTRGLPLDTDTSKIILVCTQDEGD